MNEQEIYNELVTDFNLKSLPEEDREEMLFEVAKTIHKQFLLDVYDTIGEKQFDALQASATMGEEFYKTTIKHLVPNYETIFKEAKKKVVQAFNQA
jgi:hypothetical protein